MSKPVGVRPDTSNGGSGNADPTRSGAPFATFVTVPNDEDVVKCFGVPDAVEISIVPATSADDDPFVAEVVDLVNRVYADAEKGLWLDGTERTTRPKW